jgi:hypothetical protein
VFVHGFNVPFGAFPKRLLDIEVSFDDVNSQLDIQYAQGNRTVYSDLSILQTQFPDIAQLLTMDKKLANLPPELNSSTNPDQDALNGTDAHNWFIHMEDNLNQATNQFQRDDYTKYTRCIHVAWSGDGGALNYVAATKNADTAAPRLAKLLAQLQGAKININIVAHSLGNRVLLGALNQMGTTAPEGVEHIFMWEPAVSELALSPTKINDHSLIKHDFPNAVQAVEKITVLYNQYDTTLAVPYWLASYFGIDVGDKLGDLLHNWEAIHGNGLIDDLKNSLLKTYPQIQDRLRAVLYDKDFNHLMGQWIEAFAIHPGNDTKVRANMNEFSGILTRYSQQFDCAQVLGFVGIKNRKLLEQLKDKYVPANMLKWATGHSYMHTPSADVMKYGYKKYLLNQTNGIKDFGLYDGSQFTKGDPPE